jgi:hypothetical protein
MHIFYFNIRTKKTLILLLILCSLLSCAEEIIPLTNIEFSKELLSGSINITGQQHKVWKIDSMSIDNVGQVLNNSQLNYFQKFDAFGSWSDYDGLSGVWDMPTQNTINIIIGNNTVEYYDVNVLSFMLKMKRQSEGQTIEYFYKINN